MKKDRGLIIASHRGGKGPYAENTADAFLHSIKQGADAVEMDLRYDYLRRRFYLAHDLIHRPRWKRNLLTDCLEKVPKDVMHIIELKTMSFATNIFAKRFVNFYEEHLKDRKIVVISFNPFVLIRIRRLAPKMQLGFISGSNFWHFIFQRALYQFIKPVIHVVNRRLLNEKTVKLTRSKGMQIYAYVINNVKMWHKALNFKVDGIITDVPLKFVKELTK